VSQRDDRVGRTTIELSDLWTGQHGDRRPISDLDADENSHIHGRLAIVIDGREVPRLGFFGSDDVCLNTWVPELLGLRAHLGAADGRYVFDEGEQGQPAFVFERSGDALFVSVVRSEISDADGDERWSKTPGSAEEFFTAVTRVLDQIRTQLSALGDRGERWWRQVSSRATTSD